MEARFVALSKFSAVAPGRREQAGVLREMTGRTYRRMFAATPVLRIVRV
jgi:hypothetical protein